MKKHRATIILSFFLVLALAAAAFFAWQYFTSRQTQKATELPLDLAGLYAEYNDENLATVFEGQALQLAAPAKKIGETFYLPLDLVLSHLTDALYYDVAEKVLTYTDSRDVIRLKPGEKTYYYNQYYLKRQ